MIKEMKTQPVKSKRTVAQLGSNLMDDSSTMGK